MVLRRQIAFGASAPDIICDAVLRRYARGARLMQCIRYTTVHSRQQYLDRGAATLRARDVGEIHMRCTVCCIWGSSHTLGADCDANRRLYIVPVSKSVMGLMASVPSDVAVRSLMCDLVMPRATKIFALSV